MWGSAAHSVPLHTYTPSVFKEGGSWTYSSTKIGGHPWDHLRVILDEGGDEQLWAAEPRRRFGGLPASFWMSLQETHEQAAAGPSDQHPPPPSSSSSLIPERYRDIEEFRAYRRYLDSLYGHMARAPVHPAAEWGVPQLSTVDPPVPVMPEEVRPDGYFGPSLVEGGRMRRRRPTGPGMGPLAGGAGVAVAAASVYKYLRSGNVDEEHSADTSEQALTRLYEPVSSAEAWKARVAQSPRWSQLRRYKFISSLGRGSHAETLLVERNGVCYVLKESELLPEAMNEARLLTEVASPHVVRVEDFFLELLGHRHVAYLQLEYCDGGDLAALISSMAASRGGMYPALNDRTVHSILVQIAAGLSAIHAKNIVHRDLKPENILLTSSGLVKIADLGISTRLTASLPSTTAAAGSVPFMAPEVRRFMLGEEVSYNEKADVWALGVLAYATCTGNATPNVAKTPREQLVEEVVGHRGWRPLRTRSQLVDAVCWLLYHTLDPAPELRPAAVECHRALLVPKEAGGIQANIISRL